MKTYLLTEKDVELLREEFCTSMMLSNKLDKIIKGLTSYVIFDEASAETQGHLTLEDLKEACEFMEKSQENKEK